MLTLSKYEICAKHSSAGMALTNYEDHSAQQNL